MGTLSQPSHFATYIDDDGNQVFETWFVIAAWGKGPALYAYESFQAREDAIDIAERAGVHCESLTHRKAFLIARAGTVAWLHEITAGGIQCFRKIHIRYPAAVA